MDPVSEDDYWVSVDPGVDFGLAFWEGRGVKPVLTVLHKPKKGSWTTRVQAGCDFFSELLHGMAEKDRRITKAYCENPKFFDTAGGQAVAKKGSLGKLYFWVGAFARTCYTLGIELKLIEINQWKGQLPKPLVQERIERRLGSEVCAGFRSHVWDAVGIGLWALRRF